MARVISGKTKEIVPMHVAGRGRVHTFDVITAGDGKKSDILTGKGALANAITCDVFERLEHHGVPLAFVARDGDQFITRLAEMLPFEIVVRNKSTGSALKRDTSLVDGAVNIPPVVEFFYKTTGGKIGEIQLPCDDPLVVLQDNGELWLYQPDEPPVGAPLHIIESPEGKPDYLEYLLSELKALALHVNMYLKLAWEQQGGDLWDFKIECGLVDGKIVVADVIDFDSWRVFVAGKPVSKQLYRDETPLDAVLRAMQLTAAMTKGFAI